jgi:RluA family pseudouridine synthase
MSDLGFELLYEQGPCLGILKPAGLATQAPAGIDSLEMRLKQFLKQRDNKPGNIYLGVPHRLDRPVSGVMVFARHVRAARRISEQFEARTVQKTYWACVAGEVSPTSGTWTDTLRKVYGKPLAEVVTPDHPEGRLAVLHYRVIGQTPYGSWLEIELQTGRTHQIRIQAASRGHPVLGDEMYGSKVPFGPQHDDPRLRAIALHARRLCLRHPMTKEVVDLLAPLPEPWQGLVGTQEWRSRE